MGIDPLQLVARKFYDHVSATGKEPNFVVMGEGFANRLAESLKNLGYKTIEEWEGKALAGGMVMGMLILIHGGSEQLGVGRIE